MLSYISNMESENVIEYEIWSKFYFSLFVSYFVCYFNSEFENILLFTVNVFEAANTDKLQNRNYIVLLINRFNYCTFDVFDYSPTTNTSIIHIYSQIVGTLVISASELKFNDEKMSIFIFYTTTSDEKLWKKRIFHNQSYKFYESWNWRFWWMVESYFCCRFFI